MSEQEAALEIAHQGDLAFGDLMDALVAPEEDAADPAAGAPADADAAAADTGAGGGDGAGGAPAAAAGDAPAGGSDAAPGQPGDGAAAQPEPQAGVEGGATAGAADGGAEQPAADGGAATAPGTGTLDASTLAKDLGGLSAAVEENVAKGFQHEALTQAKDDYEKYFEALGKHPRLLVGSEVPAIGREGMETLKNSEDAKEWQEAVKSLLSQEIQARVQTKMEESRDFLETVHQSIDLFKNNPDMIPGTKGFDRELADRFAAMVQPYEIRVDGKLQGYSIPVQPLIEKIRAQIKGTKSAESPPPAAQRPAQSQAQSEPPQAAVTSKAANSGEPQDDFSTLFGTIGLPNLRI